MVRSSAVVPSAVRMVSPVGGASRGGTVPHQPWFESKAVATPKWPVALHWRAHGRNTYVWRAKRPAPIVPPRQDARAAFAPQAQRTHVPDARRAFQSAPRL